MKKQIGALSLVACLAVGVIIAQQGTADAESVRQPAIQQVSQPQPAAVTTTPAAEPEGDFFNPDAEEFKKCSFSSDCKYGKCKKNKCGGCSFKSDCKGWGVCKKGWCGGCSFSSDCKGFGTCKSGRCTKSPY